jgi:AraC-like DNA-binding protein
MSGQFFEVSGILGPSIVFGLNGRPIAREDGRVVLSNLSRGSGEGAPQPSAGLKYVAEGVEVYRYGGKTYPVAAGNFLYVPEGTRGEVEIGRSEAANTLGLCVYLPDRPAGTEGGDLDLPMIFPAACSELGRLLSGTVNQMVRGKDRRPAIASELLGRIVQDVEPLLEETARIVDGVDALKAATRYETLRRLNIARGYLHAVTDRQVELAELAKVAGISRFQLLRNFRDTFGAPPAAYHRLLRLKLAKQEIDRKRLSCSEAAHLYGFADCSSFSHAYRRAFGEAPIRRVSAAA